MLQTVIPELLDKWGYACPLPALPIPLDQEVAIRETTSRFVKPGRIPAGLLSADTCRNATGLRASCGWREQNSGTARKRVTKHTFLHCLQTCTDCNLWRIIVW